MDDTRILDWIGKKSNKYTTADTENEMLMVMSLKVLRETVLKAHKTSFYTVMVDETTGSSNTEQVVLVIRWVDEQLIVHKEFIGLYSAPSTDTDTLTSVIKDSLVQLDLSLNKIRGQCYNGASSMSGAKKGAAKYVDFRY